MIETTLRDRGLRLPIGPIRDGKLAQDFTLRPYKSWVDRVLGNWRDVNHAKPPPYLIAKYLSLVIAEAGGRAFALTSEKDSSPEAELAILDWPMGDVFYAYLYSRLTTVTSSILVPFTCPRCGTSHGDIAYDLLGMGVECLETPAEARKVIKLVDGFRMRNGKICTSLTIAPVPWRVLLLPGVLSGRSGSIGYQHLREAVVAAGDEDPYSLTEEEVDDITKMDRLVIDKFAGAVSAGPSLRTVAECPGKPDPSEEGKMLVCGHVQHSPLNWSFDHFFESSVPEAALTP